MPNYKGYLVGAVGAYMATILLFSLISRPVSLLAQGLLFTCLGGLFPDIDTKSKGQKIFYIFFLGAIVSLTVLQQYHLLALVSILIVLPLVVAHRGLFHNFWFVLFLVVGIASLLIVLFPMYRLSIIRNGSFFFLGIFSHLVLDFGLVRALRLR